VAVERAAIDADARTIEVVFSSEYPVERYFGKEILDHRKGAVRMEWLSSGRAPFLVQHMQRDRVGVLDSARIDSKEKVGRAVVRFSKSARAEEVFNDYLDHVRSSISVGYVLHEAKLESEGDDGDVYRVTDWEPVEVSDVAIPADPMAGLGRGLSSREGGRDVETVFIEEREVKTLSIKVRRRIDGRLVEIEDADFDETVHERVAAGPIVREVPEPDPPKPQPTPEQIRETERIRQAEIGALAAKWNCREAGEKWVREGKSIESFRGYVLENHVPDAKPLETPVGELGLSPREAAGFSMLRALRTMLPGAKPDSAPFERECSDTIAERLGAQPRGIFVPYDTLVIERAIPITGDLRVQALLANLTRAAGQTKGTTTEGGFLVGTTHLAASFIELLRNKAKVMQLGARMLSGLVGDIEIPKQTGGGTAYWVAEDTATTESEIALGQLALSPKTVSGRMSMTRKLLLQSSPDVEDLCRLDLLTILALAIDLAAINGSGTGAVPEGILQTTGVGLVPLGTDGAAPAWGDIVDLESEVAIDNADIGALAYLTNAQMRGTLKQTPKESGQALYCWDNSQTPGDGILNGYPAAVSQQVPADLTKGAGTNLSAMIFGNWADLILAEWGVLDLFGDPYTDGDAGGLIVRAFQDVDVGVRHAESFAIIVDAITS
jgi:HK97 family phage major capsid protein